MYQSRSERAKSYYFNMRRFHNNVKRQMYDKYTKNISKLLDLACGKGGDLDKWVSNNIKSVIGYDINERSITEAQRRVREYKAPYNTQVEVYVKDLSRNVISGEQDCDVVSSMFAFHYFFESEDTFNTIMRTMDNNLKMNGYFMGTMFDGELISNLVKDSDNFKLVDDDKTRFRIKRYTPLSSNLFGNKLSVYLNETVLDEPMDEYVVYFNKFVSEMRSRGYELVESKLFEEYYEPRYALNDVEKRVSFLNRSFVFRRTGVKLVLPATCKEESEYLIECQWVDKRSKLIEKYKKALDIKAREASGKSRDDYIYLRDNFERASEVLKDTNVPSYLKAYLRDIYMKFEKQLK